MRGPNHRPSFLVPFSGTPGSGTKRDKSARPSPVVGHDRRISTAGLAVPHLRRISSPARFGASAEDQSRSATEATAMPSTNVGEVVQPRVDAKSKGPENRDAPKPLSGDNRVVAAHRAGAARTLLTCGNDRSDVPRRAHPRAGRPVDTIATRSAHESATAEMAVTLPAVASRSP